MIKSFACRDSEKLFNDRRVRRFQAFERQARKRLMVLHAAPSIEALMLNPAVGRGTPSRQGDAHENMRCSRQGDAHENMRCITY